MLETQHTTLKTTALKPKKIFGLRWDSLLEMAVKKNRSSYSHKTINLGGKLQPMLEQ